MQYSKCKFCGYEDDQEYLHLVYLGHSSRNIHANMCEKCQKKYFSDPERLNPETSQEDVIV